MCLRSMCSLPPPISLSTFSTSPLKYSNTPLDPLGDIPSLPEISQFTIGNVYTLVYNLAPASYRPLEGPATTNFTDHHSTEQAAKSQVQPAVPKRRRTYDCDRCGKGFYRKSELVSHMLTYKYPCSICEKTFRLKKDLIEHAEAEHDHLELQELPELCKCTDCHFRTPMKSELRNHIQRYHSTGYSYYCKICQKGFKMKGNMTAHIKNAHCVVRTVKCCVCNAPFNNDLAMQNHMRTVHNSTYYQCVQCKRFMASAESLEQHMKWHSEEKSTCITCPKCGKVLRGRTLTAHLRVHTGQKPFTCPVCGKTFRRLSPMERHVVIHTGKKPYVCDVCGQKFAQRPGLLSHRKRHTGPLPPLPVVSIKNIVRDFVLAYGCTKHKSVEVDG